MVAFKRTCPLIDRLLFSARRLHFVDKRQFRRIIGCNFDCRIESPFGPAARTRVSVKFLPLFPVAEQNRGKPDNGRHPRKELSESADFSI